MDNVYKIGYLKCDLYINNTNDVKYRLLSEEEKVDAIEQFKLAFTLALPKGSKFVCYKNSDGTDAWFDDVKYGLESLNKEWAEKYLENVEIVNYNNQEELMY